MKGFLQDTQIEKYLSKEKNINILQIGFYDSKLSLKLIPLISKNKKSKLYLVNSWTEYLDEDRLDENDFIHDLEDTGYGKQIINLKIYLI